MIAVPGERRPVLRLNNGNRLQVEGWPLANRRYHPRQVSEFDSVDAPLGKVADKAFRLRGDDERELTLPELVSQQAAPPPGARPLRGVRAELHKRIVNIVLHVGPPFLAIPFAVGGRRNSVIGRFGVALVLVIVYHEVIEQGGVIAGKDLASPWLALWMPFGLLTVFAAWRYFNACFTVKRDAVGQILGIARRKDECAACSGLYQPPGLENSAREDPRPG